MKKFLLCLVALAIVSTGAYAQKKVNIGVTIAIFDDVWLTFVREAMQAWADKKGDINLTIVDAKNDTARQVGQVETFLAQKMDAIVILPVDTSATGPMTASVTKAGKGLVYVNRNPDNLPKGVVYVGSRSIDSGIFLMEQLGKDMGGKGNIVIMMGELSNEAAHGRTDGIKQVIKQKYPNIKVLKEETANWKRDEGRTLMENWLASGLKIDGVASNNDEMALGALLAIEAAGMLGKIKVGGVDGSPDALQSIEAGQLNNTVYQDPVGQGEGAIEAAYLIATKKANPRVKDGIVWIPYQPITKANYKKFMK